MHEVKWTTDARQEWEKLSDELRAEADRVINRLAQDPFAEGTHPIPGDPTVRQLVTKSALCITYMKAGNMMIIVVLQLFTKFAD